MPEKTLFDSPEPDLGRGPNDALLLRVGRAPVLWHCRVKSLGEHVVDVITAASESGGRDAGMRTDGVSVTLDEREVSGPAADVANGDDWWPVVLGVEPVVCCSHRLLDE
jgi:hypothetical protein